MTFKKVLEVASKLEKKLAQTKNEPMPVELELENVAPNARPVNTGALTTDELKSTPENEQQETNQ